MFDLKTVEVSKDVFESGKRILEYKIDSNTYNVVISGGKTPTMTPIELFESIYPDLSEFSMTPGEFIINEYPEEEDV